MKKYLPTNLFNEDLSLPEIKGMLHSLKRRKSKMPWICFIFGVLVLGGVAAAIVFKLRGDKDDDFDDDFDDDDFDDFDDDDLDDEESEDTDDFSADEDDDSAKEV